MLMPFRLPQEVQASPMRHWSKTHQDMALVSLEQLGGEQCTYVERGCAHVCEAEGSAHVSEGKATYT